MNRAHVRNQLDHWSKVRAEQIAAGEAPNYSRDDVQVGGWVKGWVGDREYRIVKANPKTVEIATMRSALGDGKWLTNKMPYWQITAYRPPEVGE